MSENFIEPPDTWPEFPDDFESIVDGLKELSIDPFVASVHRAALDAEKRLAAQNTPENNQAITQELDALWSVYNQLNIRISGRALLHIPGQKDSVPRILSQESVTSMGFMFTEINSDLPKANHCFLLNENGIAIKGIIAVSDVQDLELPFPSPGQRIKRFRYHYSKHAQHIDELVQTSPRDDQILKSFGEFTMLVNLDDDIGVQAKLDAEAYLYHLANIEPYANYALRLRDLPCISCASTEPLPHAGCPITHTAAIHSIELWPVQLGLKRFSGPVECAPFIGVTIFYPERDLKASLPCSSIASIRSLRYIDDWGALIQNHEKDIREQI